MVWRQLIKVSGRNWIGPAARCSAGRALPLPPPPLPLPGVWAYMHAYGSGGQTAVNDRPISFLFLYCIRCISLSRPPPPPPPSAG